MGYEVLGQYNSHRTMNMRDIVPSTTHEFIKMLAITDVWHALGGGELHGNRGRAFWRNSDGWSVAINANKNVWYDHRDAVGGGILDLVQHALGCDWSRAIEWAAGFAGAPIAQSVTRAHVSITADWWNDLRIATWWGITAIMFAEEALETLPFWHCERYELTQILSTINSGEKALVMEYRDWRAREPRLTAAMVHAGRVRDARVQRNLARWIRRHFG
jgi:hypothetical protein